MNRILIALVGLGLVAALAGCAVEERRSAYAMSVQSPTAAPPLDPKRPISEQDCSKPIEMERGNLMCR